MDLINESLISERGTNMKPKVREAKRTHLIAALVGIVAMSIFAADASAMYHPGMGTFMQRDPGAGGAHRLGAGGAPAATGRFIPRDPTGSNQYADGMNLYQYTKSNPIVGTDPQGTIVVMLSGLGQSDDALRSIREATLREIGKRMQKYSAQGDGIASYYLVGGGGMNSMRQLEFNYRMFLKRKERDKCSLEQFVAIGHSDGATAIWHNLSPQANTFTGGNTGEFTPAYLGMVDMVRKMYCPFLSFFGYQVNNSADGTASISAPANTWVDAFRQDKGAGFFAWKGRRIIGASANFGPYHDVNHFEIIEKQQVIQRISTKAAEEYERRVQAEKRPKPWVRHMFGPW